MHKHDPTNLKPCKHMETLVSAMLDGCLTGIMLWYTKAHIKACPKCTASVPFFGKLKNRMSELSQKSQAGQMPPERWSNVEKGWDETDAKASATPPV